MMSMELSSIKDADDQLKIEDQDGHDNEAFNVEDEQAIQQVEERTIGGEGRENELGNDAKHALTHNEERESELGNDVKNGEGREYGLENDVKLNLTHEEERESELGNDVKNGEGRETCLENDIRLDLTHREGKGSDLKNYVKNGDGSESELENDVKLDLTHGKRKENELTNDVKNGEGRESELENDVKLDLTHGKRKENELTNDVNNGEGRERELENDVKLDLTHGKRKENELTNDVKNGEGRERELVENDVKLDLTHGGGNDNELQKYAKNGDGKDSEVQKYVQNDEGKGSELQKYFKNSEGRDSGLKIDLRINLVHSDGKEKELKNNAKICLIHGKGRENQLKNDVKLYLTHGNRNEHELESYVKTGTGRDGELKTHVTNVKGRESDMENEVKNVEGRENELENDVKNDTGRQSELKTHVANVEGRESELKTYVAKVEGRKNELKTYVANVEGRESELKTHVANVEGRESELKTHVANVEGRESELKTHVANVEGRESELKTYVANVEGRESELKTYVANAERRENDVKNGTGMNGELKNHVKTVEGRKNEPVNDVKIDLLQGRESDLKNNVKIDLIHGEGKDSELKNDVKIGESQLKHEGKIDFIHDQGRLRDLNNDVKIDLSNGGEEPRQLFYDIKDEPHNACSRLIYKIQTSVSTCYAAHKSILVYVLYVVLLLLYFAYFGYAMYHSFGTEGAWRLLICTAFAVIIIVCKLVSNVYNKEIDYWYRNTWKKFYRRRNVVTAMKWATWLLKIFVFVFLAVYIILDVAVYYPSNLVSVAGLTIYIVLFFLFSSNPSKINWHPVFWGLALQYIFALVILRTYWGYQAFKWIGDRVTELLNYTDAGAVFVFGEVYKEHFFAFNVLSIVVFFNTLISVLYYLGVMQFIIRNIGRFLAFCLGTTAAESLNAAGNIFVGMTQAGLIIRPYLDTLTMSELFAVMTGGFATVAGSVLGAYIGFGVSANHLISASVMSAPAALAIAKIAMPETEKTRASLKDYYILEKSKERNIIEAASAGALESIKLCAAIAVNVIAFLCLLEMVDQTLIWFGDQVGVEGFTLEFICSYVLFPVSYFMGAEVKDCRKIAELIGIKTFTTEFIAYKQLAVLIGNKRTFRNYTSNFNMTTDWMYSNEDIVLIHDNTTLIGGILSDKSEVIATYALCGFSNINSIGVMLGGLGALAPSRRSDMTKIVFKAMIAGNVACFLTACIAGLLYKDYD